MVPTHHLTEEGVLAIPLLLLRQRDVEQGGVVIRSQVAHRQHSCLVVGQFVVDLVVEGLTENGFTTIPSTCGITSLDELILS